MKPINTSGLHPHEPKNNILMNTTTFWNILKNTTTFWSISIYPEFKVKVGGSQDTWHKTIGHTPTATRSQETL